MFSSPLLCFYCCSCKGKGSKRKKACKIQKAQRGLEEGASTEAGNLQRKWNINQYSRGRSLGRRGENEGTRVFCVEWEHEKAKRHGLEVI